ncbi:MAG: phosphate ABC transporter substrate-binding protein [Planctomycetes bacterium]|nr:phosphate ABC transporter substrate-binding protein [Planctomycetota bacterium]
MAKLSKLLLPALALGLIGLSSCGRPAEGSGRSIIRNIGSDTLVNVAQSWSEAYGTVHPETQVAVSGGGSGTGISAMIDGTVDIANSSREMKSQEIEAAKKNGVQPLKHVVGFDAIAVYVHKDNPIEKLTLAQLASIYGEGGNITKWSQLGVKLSAKADNIVRISRQNNSGTYSYFKSVVLGKAGEYKLGSLDMHGSKDVVEQVSLTVGAIGYSGLAYANDHVRMVPVVNESGAAVGPSVESAMDNSYPIARPLLMYTAGEPTGKIKEYMDWILSDEGQKILRDKGYASVR